MGLGGLNPGCDESDCCDATYNCNIASDDFESADPLTDDWEGDTGDFSKGSGVVSCSTPSVVIVHSTGEYDGSQYIVYYVNGDTQNDRVRLIGGYVDDDNYLYIEVAIRGTGSLFRLGQRVGGVDSILKTGPSNAFTTGSFHKVVMCIDADNMRLSGNLLSSAGLFSAATVLYTLDPIGDQAGLGTGTLIAGTVEFDDWLFSVGGDDNPACPFCTVAECEGCCDPDSPPPLNLTADFGPPQLTNDSCNQCDEFGGEYDVVAPGGNVFDPDFACGWSYTSDFLDDCDPDPPFTGNCTDFFIRVDVWMATSGEKCKWKARFLLSHLGDASCGGTTAEAFAEYEADGTFDSDECQSFPVTLQKVDEGWTGTCQGNFPDTMTVRP